MSSTAEGPQQLLARVPDAARAQGSKPCKGATPRGLLLDCCNHPLEDLFCENVSRQNHPSMPYRQSQYWLVGSAGLSILSWRGMDSLMALELELRP